MAISGSVVAEVRKEIVTQVVDGDTIRIGGGQLVRLIGIDAPESRENDRTHLQAKRTKTDIKTILELGRRSSVFLERKLPLGSAIKLELDVEPRDRYGRLLAYIYLQDGTFINALILKMGYAKLLTVPPNVRYLEDLRAAYSEGRAAHRGLWSFEGFDVKG